MRMAMKNIKQKLRTASPIIFEGTPVLFAYLYGSHARGLSHPFSDPDVGVFVKGLDVRACLDLELSPALRLDEQSKMLFLDRQRPPQRKRVNLWAFLPVRSLGIICHR